MMKDIELNAGLWLATTACWLSLKVQTQIMIIVCRHIMCSDVKPCWEIYPNAKEKTKFSKLLANIWKYLSSISLFISLSDQVNMPNSLSSCLDQSYGCALHGLHLSSFLQKLFQQKLVVVQHRIALSETTCCNCRDTPLSRLKYSWYCRLRCRVKSKLAFAAYFKLLVTIY